MRTTFFISFILLVFCACNKRELDSYQSPAAAQHAYFPLETGTWIEYQVDSIVYDFGLNNQTVQDSSTTFIREEIGDTFTDLEGKTVYKIARKERKKSTDDWKLRAIWSAQQSDNQAIRSEDNQRFLRLIFPFDRRSEWNGLVYLNTEQDIPIAGELMRPYTNWQTEVDSLDIAGTVGAFSFDSLLYITEADDANIIERRFVKSIYAKNVGLVQREEWILDSQYCNQDPVPSDCETRPWNIKAEKGYILRQTVLDYSR